MAIKKIVRPTFGRILVRRHAPSETAGSIIKPEQSINKPNEGTVMALGPEVWTRARYAEEFGDVSDGTQTFELGDHVLFGNYAGKEIEVNEGETFVLLQKEEIEGVVVSVEVPDAEPSIVTVEDEGRPA